MDYSTAALSSARSFGMTYLECDRLTSHSGRFDFYRFPFSLSFIFSRQSLKSRKSWKRFKGPIATKYTLYYMYSICTINITSPASDERTRN